MNRRLIKAIIALALLVYPVIGFGQSFDTDKYQKRDMQIDSLLALENYSESIPLIENQIAYLKKTGRIDSLQTYTYALGRAYLMVQGPQVALSRTQENVDWIAAHQTNTSLILEAISDLSWIAYEGGLDSACLETDLRYLALCEQYPGASPMEQSTAHYSLGFDYEVLFGNAKKAIYHFEKALEPIIADSMKYKGRVLDAMNALGAAYFRNGSYRESQASLFRALNFSKILPDSVDKWSQQANIYGNLALGFEDEGNLVKSKDYLYHSMSLRRQLLDSLTAGYKRDQQRRLLISNYNNLAALNLKIGDVSKAQKVIQYMSALRSKWLSANHPDNAKTLEALGSIDYALGEYDDALANFEKYLSRMIAQKGKISLHAATGYERVAKVLFEKGDYPDAIKNYTAAIEIGKELADAESGQDLAMAYLLRSQAHIKLNQYTEAERDIYAARNIYTQTLPDDSPIQSKLFLLLADLKSDQNQLDSAQFYIDLTLAKMVKKQRAQENKYGSLLSSYSQFLPQAYEAKARLILQQQKDTTGQKQALRYLSKAAGYLQNTQNLYPGESSILTLFEDNSSVFYTMEELCYELYTATGNQAYIDSLYVLDEAHKSVLIRRHLNAFSSLRVASVPDSIITRERMLLAQLSDMNQMAEGSVDIQKIEMAYGELRDKIKTDYPRYDALRYNRDVCSIADIQADLLTPQKSLIQYVLTDSNAFAIVINKKHRNLVALDFSPSGEVLKALNSSITRMNAAEFKTLSVALYAQLFEPVEQYIQGTDVYIVPDGKLFNLNFEVLQKPGGSHSPDFLINHYTFSYLLSGTTALQYENLKTQHTTGLLSFAPGFFDSMKEEYRAQARDTALYDVQYLQNIQQPFAVAVAQNVAALFSGRAFIAGKATEKNFKTEAGKYGIIHLGTHTEINNLSPLLSRLVLSKDGGAASTTDDGYLHAYEIYQLSLRAELAVLTACETGIGKYSSSEGVRSLAHGFAYAGCPSIVMSLWQIDEKTASEIIEVFYENLSEGMPKNTALQEAKRHYLETHTGELSAPYYWSGLVLVGDTSPISATQGSGFLWFILMGVAAVVFVLLFIPFGKK